MPKMKDQEPLLPERDALFRTMGLGRRTMLLISTALVVSIAGNVGQAFERHWLTKTLKSQVFVVVSDPAGNVIELAKARSDWRYEEAVWLTSAKRWLMNIRARTPDQVAWRRQMQEVVATTAANQYGPINEWLSKTAKQFRLRGDNASIEVEILGTTFRGEPDWNGASVNVQWRERIVLPTGKTGPWVVWAGTISLARLEPGGDQEIKDNPWGIYVTYHSYYAVDSDGSGQVRSIGVSPANAATPEGEN